MDFLAWIIQGFEKPEPLDMIHVEMCEEEVNAPYLRPDGRPQASDPRAGIEHHQGSVIPLHFDT
jgi:hypothetical protein